MEKSYQALVADRIYLGAASDVQAMIDNEAVEVVVDLREESTGLAAQAPAVEWQRIPLGDNNAEPQDKLFGDAIQAVVAAYRSGKKVAFHCGGGKGRTGTVAAGVLLELGICPSFAEAEASARSIRPTINIKTEQRAALEALYPQCFEATKGTSMKTLKVYDPALCCSTGVCGTDVDQALVSFSADVAWATAQGASIERFNLAQQPMAFAENAVVKGFLERSGAEALPLILLDGEVALAGRYPNRAELTRWLGLQGEAVAAKPCCSGSRCC
ncbi:hypothetical protein GCM10025771_35110 [Niveibacterium umoris]|uniref:Protein-tyrosine phosphatase n=2 Tax=Niveibacterium umoris TaxID=1193620 RepID=A0A840BDX6_9RHOO|nr:protein-tyrosine phosphatase [Niveibacterium umoris]